MNATEAAQLLTVAAELDARVVVTVERAKVWAGVLADVDYAAGQRAVVAHYRESDQSLLPVHVIDGVRAERIDRPAPVLPPRYARLFLAAGIPPEEYPQRAGDEQWLAEMEAKYLGIEETK